jgi:hypothetical protein
MPISGVQAAPQFRHRITVPRSAGDQARKGGDQLTVTLSVALMLGAAVVLLCRYAGLKIWHAAVCLIFGFYLASTSFAPDISQFTESLFRHL